MLPFAIGGDMTNLVKKMKKKLLKGEKAIERVFEER
jgi:hypothetical protein